MSYYADTIRSSVSMREACERYGLEVNRAGFCSCPFHQERTASFKVYPDSYYCFGCHAHGSVIDFVMQYFGLGFMPAVEKLNDDFSLNLPINRKPTIRERHAMAKPAVNTQAIELARLEQMESEAKADWIRADRIISEEEKNGFTDNLITAVRDRSEAEFRWRECEVRLYELRQHQRNDRAGSAERADIS